MSYNKVRLKNKKGDSYCKASNIKKMKRDNIFVKLKNSFYNTDKIAEYSTESVGKSVTYSLLVSALIGLVSAIIIALSINYALNLFNEKFNEDNYKFTISNGELSLNVDTPKSIESSGVKIYIDDEISVDDIDKIKKVIVNVDEYYLILKDGVMTNASSAINGTQEQSIKYCDIIPSSEKEINNNTIISFLDSIKGFTITIIFITVIIVSIVKYLFMSLIIAIVLYIISLIMKVNIKFGQAFSLTIYVLTLPSFMSLILTLVLPAYNISFVCNILTILFGTYVLYNIQKNKVDEIV